MSKKSSSSSLTPLKQCTLNFGQKSSPKTSNECKECGMIYRLNDKQEEQMHTKYHKENKETSLLKYSCLRGNNEKIVLENSHGKCIVIEYGIDSQNVIQKALNVLDFVDDQLGIGVGEKHLIKEKSESSSNRSLKKFSKFYFFISSISKQIVGFVLAEPIDFAQRITYLNKNENTFTATNENQCLKAKCGINRIWVASNMRRQGIATHLLDCVCVNFIYIQKLEATDLAFSDPTEFGRKLAKSYCKTDSFLIYNCSNN